LEIRAAQNPIGGDFAKIVWPGKRVLDANRRIMDHCQNIAFGYGSDTGQINYAQLFLYFVANIVTEADRSYSHFLLSILK
jgi:hypothetical protein